MASLVYTVVSMVQVASLHCSMRPEISPCSCSPHEILNNTIHVTCEGLDSFNQVFDSLQNKFQNRENIWLKITKSQLNDLETRTFKDMNMNITQLILNFDDLRTLPESSFRNLTNLGYLSLADNNLDEIPRHILSHMPKVVTVDLAHGRIRKIHADDFRNLKKIRNLVLVNNDIKLLEKESIPNTLRMLHLGRNNLTSLNGTLRENDNLQVLFLNENSLTTLDNELPIKPINFKSLTAHHNKLQSLPQELKHFATLDTMYISDNEIRSFEGILKHLAGIQTLSAHNNKIEYLAHDEFAGTAIQELDLANNYIKAINGSLSTLQEMRYCNFSRNLLSEFSLNDIRRLYSLQVIDLSFNRIERITGRMENIIESEIYVNELILDHNLLKSLDAALMGLNRLKTLSLAHNLLRTISSDDLIGLEELESLDISHNDLNTLEETAKTFLPRLEKLDASFNNLTKLERDFHGFPVLCFADLSGNRISAISPELVAKTRCNNHGVLNKLEILLQENPILCMDELSRLFIAMESQETRLLGIAHCIVPKEQLPIEPPSVFVAPPIPLLPANILNAPIPVLSKALLDSKPGIVQLIMPVTIETTTIPSTTTNTPITTTPFETTPKTIASETIETTTSVPVPISEVIVVQTEVEMTVTTPKEAENNITVERASESTNSTSKAKMPELIAANMHNNEVNIDNKNPEQPAIVYSTVPSTTTIPAVTETIETTTRPIVITTSTFSSAQPVLQTESWTTTSTSTKAPIDVTTTPISVAEIILRQPETISMTPEQDNYVYETFSSVPEVIGPLDERAQQLVLVEEPPEDLPNDAAPAA